MMLHHGVGARVGVSSMVLEDGLRDVRMILEVACVNRVWRQVIRSPLVRADPYLISCELPKAGRLVPGYVLPGIP